MSRKFLTTTEIAAIDAGAPRTLEQLIELDRSLSFAVYNRAYKFEHASTKFAGKPTSAALGSLNKHLESIKDLTDTKYGIPMRGRASIRNEKGQITSKAQSREAVLRQDIQAKLNFLRSPGSRVSGAKKELMEARKKLGIPDMTYKDLKDYWEIYDEWRDEIESSSLGSPEYQKRLAEWFAEKTFTKEELKRMLGEEVGADRPSTITEDISKETRV